MHKLNLFQNYVYFTLQIDSVFETYDTFFNLHVQVKEKYAKKEGTSPNGWDAIERERWVNIETVNLVSLLWTISAGVFIKQF